MSQVFRPSADWVLRLAVSGILLVSIGALVAWHQSLASQPPVGQPVEQPVPFSHKHHVSEVGLDCRYCHTSVESSNFAGIPPTTTCMTCHSQLFRTVPMLAPVRRSLAQDQPLHWKRLHQLPDFVYFNHSIHVLKGVGCETCHGPVDEMQLTYRAEPLTMRWCLRCHRAPERYLRPRDHVFDMDWKPQQDQLTLGRELVTRYGIHTDRLTDCSVCHR
jgi:hypothetical protein